MCEILHPRLIIEFRKGGYLGLRWWTIRTYLPKIKNGELWIWWPRSVGWVVFWRGLRFYVERPKNLFQLLKETS